MAPASGDTFGLNSDSYIQVNQNISTIVDLLEDGGISWSDYNEGQFVALCTSLLSEFLKHNVHIQSQLQEFEDDDPRY